MILNAGNAKCAVEHELIDGVSKTAPLRSGMPLVFRSNLFTYDSFDDWSLWSVEAFAHKPSGEFSILGFPKFRMFLPSWTRPGRYWNEKTNSFKDPASDNPFGDWEFTVTETAQWNQMRNHRLPNQQKIIKQHQRFSLPANVFRAVQRLVLFLAGFEIGVVCGLVSLSLLASYCVLS